MRLGKRNRGYSLVELLVATALFTIITGTVFSLLMSSQLQYQGESSVTEAFQQANVAIDQIVRDVHSAGFPPKNSFMITVSDAHPENYALPFAWSPKYPATPCTLKDCAIPGKYDLILEADTGNGVQWIRYSLKDQTLKRAITRKAPSDPVTSTEGDLLPYLDGVMNGDQGLAIFSYECDRGAPESVSNIREVNINLIVQSAKPDPVTHVFRTINLTGQAVRFNPNQ